MANDSMSDEDKALFRKAMNTVKPLSKNKRATLKAKPLPKRMPTTKIESNTPINPYNLSNHYNDPVNAESILVYCKQSIPRKRLSQLKHGQIPWQARLDLHGLRPDAAREVLCQFIDQQYQLEHRCLLIIHGKGSQDGEAPILKNLVNKWLQQLPQILAFHSALARDGGTGALYVLLKRHRLHTL